MTKFQTVEQLQATVAEQAQEIENLKIAASSDYDEGYNDAQSDHDVTIASLTAENKRLRALVEGAYKEGWADSALSPSDDLYIDWLNSTTRAALQPKEGV